MGRGVASSGSQERGAASQPLRETLLCEAGGRSAGAGEAGGRSAGAGVAGGRSAGAAEQPICARARTRLQRKNRPESGPAFGCFYFAFCRGGHGGAAREGPACGN